MKITPNASLSQKIRKLTMSAVFAALICAATMVIQIPSPMTGYVNLGDAVVLLAAFFLGFPYGVAAAAVGSALADVFTGYLLYAPGTFLIKGAMAASAYLILRFCRTKSVPVTLSAVLGGIAAEGIMVTGYFLYAGLILGNGWAAASSIPGNVVQGIAGCVISTVLYTALYKKGMSKS